MQSNPPHAVERLTDWRRRVKALSDSGVRLSERRNALASDLQRTEAEILTLDQSVARLSQVGELFRVLMDHMVQDQVKSLESVITDGLQTIFDDQKLYFDAEVTTRYNKIAIDFLMRRLAGDVTIQDKPLEGFGGGPVSVASLLLRILTLMRLNRYPLLFLDETLSAVSDGYIDNTGKFLQHLARKLGIDILLVTHKQAFLDNADTAYRGQEASLGDGSCHLELKSLK